MKHLATILHAALILLTSSAAVPLRWTVETSRATPAAFEAYQGETLEFEAALTSHGKPLQAPSNYALYWQTNGMGGVYWSTNCATGAGATNVMLATWRPEFDAGAKVYNCFIGAPGDIYHAAFQLRLRPSPGAVPGALPLPTPTIDFARVTVFNPPWPTNDLTSAVMSNAAAIASHVADINNPHRVTAEQLNGRRINLSGDEDYLGLDLYDEAWAGPSPSSHTTYGLNGINVHGRKLIFPTNLGADGGTVALAEDGTNYVKKGENIQVGIVSVEDDGVFVGDPMYGYSDIGFARINLRSIGDEAATGVKIYPDENQRGIDGLGGFVVFEINDYFRGKSKVLLPAGRSGTLLVNDSPTLTNEVQAVGVVSSDVIETNETPRLFAAAPGRGLLAAMPPQSVTTQRLDTARAIVDYTRRFVATAATQGTNYTDVCCGAIAVAATNYTDVAMTAAIRSAENYTDDVLDSAAYLPRYYFKGGRWYRQDLVDNGPDDIEMTLERYGDDVFVWFEAVDGPATVTLTNVKASATAPKLERLKDGAWSPFAFPVLLAEGERVIFRTQYGVTNSAYWKSDTENWKFGGTGRYAVGGNATALFVYEGSIPCPAEAFHGLFENNECLVDASRLVLPFAELAYDCYAFMFAGCSNLAKGPHVLPAKDVPERGYLSMFNGCETLDLAPRILAEDAAATYAMANMFVNCNALDHVYTPYLTNATAYALFGFANNATNVSRIATLVNTFGGSFANGTTDRGVLICKTSLGTQETIARGANACPTNWLVENIDAPFVQFTNAYGVPSEVTVLWSSGTVPKLEYSTDGETWTAITLVKGTSFTLATLNSYGDRVMVRAETGKTNVAMKGTQFLATGKVDVSGNIMSLVSQSCPAAIPANNMFMGLFGLTSTPSDAESVWDSDGIAASDGLMLPSVSLKQYCYDEMFAHCRRMRYSPLTLPAANLQQRNYCLMFWRCIDMIETPDVLASSASSTLSIRSIFMNCISARRARFPNFANVTQNATFNWALRCDEWFSHQDVKWEYIETVMSPFAKNNEWVQGLEYTRGLFVCPVSLGNRETIRRGDSACPVGWDVINY